jgi:hypothetical protein
VSGAQSERARDRGSGAECPPVAPATQPAPAWQPVRTQRHPLDSPGARTPDRDRHRAESNLARVFNGCSDFLRPRRAALPMTKGDRRTRCDVMQRKDLLACCASRHRSNKGVLGDS